MERVTAEEIECFAEELNKQLTEYIGGSSGHCHEDDFHKDSSSVAETNFWNFRNKIGDQFCRTNKIMRERQSVEQARSDLKLRSWQKYITTAERQIS